MSDSSDEEESMPHEQDKPNCPSVPDTRQSDLAGFNGSSDAFTRNAPLSKGDAGDDTRTKTSQATVACQGRIPGPSHRYEDCEMDYGSTRPVDTISDMNVLEHEQSNIPARPDQLKFGKVDPALQAGHETRDLGRATHHVGRNGSNIPLRRSQRSSVRDTRRE